VEPDTQSARAVAASQIHWLAEHKDVDARGIEINSTLVQRAIARSVSVYQGDIDQGLADYPTAPSIT